MSSSAQFANDADLGVRATGSTTGNDIDALLDYTRAAWTAGGDAVEAAGTAHHQRPAQRFNVVLPWSDMSGLKNPLRRAH